MIVEYNPEFCFSGREKGGQGGNTKGKAKLVGPKAAPKNSQQKGATKRQQRLLHNASEVTINSFRETVGYYITLILKKITDYQELPTFDCCSGKIRFDLDETATGS